MNSTSPQNSGSPLISNSSNASQNSAKVQRLLRIREVFFMSRNKNLTGGLFDGRGKPQPLQVSAKAKQIVTPEKHIQSAFIGWRNINRRQYPILRAIFAVPNGLWAQNVRVAVAMVAQGLTKGIQDVICLAPSADGKYHGLLIEFKSKIGKLSAEQLFFQNFFNELGYRSEVCRTTYEACMLVNEHLNLKIPVYPR